MGQIWGRLLEKGYKSVVILTKPQAHDMYNILNHMQ
jgi:hypothetical protein